MRAQIDFEESLKFVPVPSQSDIVKKAKQLIEGRSDAEIFEMAYRHFVDALNFSQPRLHRNMGNLYLVYEIQSSQPWTSLTTLLSYIFMCMALLGSPNPSTLQLTAEALVLGVFLLDFGMEAFHRKYETLVDSSKYQSRFIFKAVVLCCLAIDFGMFLLNRQQRSRPLLFARCLLPILYHRTLRKNFQAMAELRDDVIVYTFFYFAVILAFSVALNQFVVQDEGEQYDPYTEDFSRLGTSMFIVYCLASYQAFPENEWKSIRHSRSIMFMYLFFILLNMFMFVNIPTSLLFQTFKESKSKTILVEEIKQQNSMILSFVCLSKNEQQISRDRVLKFLLYCYDKDYFLDFVIRVVAQLDENNNNCVEMSEFMQLGKIIQAHGSPSPALLGNWQKWVQFRRDINRKYGLKQFLMSAKFRVMFSVAMLLSTVSCLLCLYTDMHIFRVIDHLFTFLFVLQLTVKLIGIGPHNYFMDPWDKLDFSIIMLVLALFLCQTFHGMPLHRVVVRHNLLYIVKLTRTFRLAVMVKHLVDSSRYAQSSDIYVKASRMVTQMMMTIPIVLQFFPVYMVFFYFFGAVGLLLAGLSRPEMSAQESPYSKYSELANFENFLSSQFFMVQLMVEGGWSSVAVDYAHRYHSAYVLVLVLFVACHFAIVLIISSLIKGVIWDIYQEIEQQYTRKSREALTVAKQDNYRASLLAKLTDVKGQIANMSRLELDNVIAREIYEYKVDDQINSRFLQALRDPANRYQLRSPATNRPKQLTGSSSLEAALLESCEEPREEEEQPRSFLRRMLSKVSMQDIEAQDLEKQDIQNEAERLTKQVSFAQGEQFTETICHPDELALYLEHKLLPLGRYSLDTQTNKYTVDSIIKKECMSEVPDTKTSQISDQDQSLDLLVYTMEEMLGIKTSVRAQKTTILDCLLEQGVIDEDEAVALLQKKQELDDSEGVYFSSDYILKKTFLQNTSEKFAKKLQIQYFSSIYGPRFKEVDKIAMQPMARLLSKLVWTLTNILRHGNMEDRHFFRLLSQIQNSISHKLLKKGSIFKFMFQIDSLAQTWFCLKVRQNNQIKLSFIKNGVWTHLDSHQPGLIYLAKDLFNWEQVQAIQKMKQSRQRLPQDESLQKYEERKILLKTLFQSFETLALSLRKGQSLWEGNPNLQLYDYYSFFKDVRDIRREQRRFCISKIMVAVLSKQGERIQYSMEPILCPLTKIQAQNEYIKSKLFSFIVTSLEENSPTEAEEDEDILKKLRKVENMDDEEIDEGEGLPNQFIVNLLQEVSGVLQLYAGALVDRMEKLLNRERSRRGLDKGATRDIMKLFVNRTVSLDFEQ